MRNQCESFLPLCFSEIIGAAPWLRVGASCGPLGRVEIRPPDTRPTFHDLQAIQVLRPVSSHDVWVPWRGPRVRIARLQLDRRHQDQGGELCVEVRTLNALL
jgi:hypothetical protein